jgi:hypothetical protein
MWIISWHNFIILVKRISTGSKKIEEAEGAKSTNLSYFMSEFHFLPHSSAFVTHITPFSRTFT